MSTFLVQQQELANRLGAYDQTISADATKLKRWLNMGQQYVAGKKNWPFLYAEEIVQTVTDYTTGTCTVSAAGSTVTFSGTITASKTGQYIRFASSNDWYKITAHTGGTSTATISPAAISANTAAAYTIRKLLYTTTTPLIQIFDMKQLVYPARIISQSVTENDFFAPLYFGAGIPYCYVMSSPTSTGAMQWSFIFSPDTVINVMVRGVQVLADMSADGDLSPIPSPWHDAIIHAAAFYGFQGLDDTRGKDELALAESRISDMARNYTHDAGRHRVVRPVDENSSGALRWVLPYKVDA